MGLCSKDMDTEHNILSEFPTVCKMLALSLLENRDRGYVDDPT